MSFVKSCMIVAFFSTLNAATPTQEMRETRFSMTNPRIEEELIQKIKNLELSPSRQEVDINLCWDGIIEQLNEVLLSDAFQFNVKDVTSDDHPGVKVTFSNGVAWGLMPFSNEYQDASASTDGDLINFHISMTFGGILSGNVHVNVLSPNGTWFFEAPFNQTYIYRNFDAYIDADGNMDWSSAGDARYPLKVDLEQLQLGEEMEGLVLEEIDSGVNWGLFYWTSDILLRDYIFGTIGDEISNNPDGPCSALVPAF